MRRGYVQTDYRRGKLLLATKQYEAAIEAFLTHAEDHEHDAPTCYARVAECYRRSDPTERLGRAHPALKEIAHGHRSEAVAYYRMALSLDPRHAASLRGLRAMLEEKLRRKKTTPRADAGGSD